MKKSVLIMVIVMMVCMVACRTTDTAKNGIKEMSTTETESLKNEEWGELYIKFIEDNFQQNEFSNINYISLNDLNIDGVPELIISDDAASAAYYVGVFQIINGQVELVMGHVNACNNMGQEYIDPLSFEVDIYSVFDEEWMTLRKNKENDDFMYVFDSWNGSDMEKFGNIISVCADSQNRGKLKITNEFEYVDYTESDIEDEYYIKGRKVSFEEYENALNAFEELWQNTGVRNYAMASKFCRYSPKMSVNPEKDGLTELFEKYEPERSVYLKTISD